MYYSYVEIEYVATSSSPTRTDLALKLLTNVDYLLSIILSKLDLCATTLTNDKQPITDWPWCPPPSTSVKLVSKGRKWYHKTLNANILGENDKTKLVIEGHKQYHKVYEDPEPEPVPFDPNHNPDNNPDPSESPCSDNVMTFVNCLQSKEMSEDENMACTECLRKTIEDLEVGTMCFDFEEVGYCDDVVSCEVMATVCNNKCTDEITTAMACITYYGGCYSYQFESECLSGI